VGAAADVGWSVRTWEGASEGCETGTEAVEGADGGKSKERVGCICALASMSRYMALVKAVSEKS
jgi:hypothetical protein